MFSKSKFVSMVGRLTNSGMDPLKAIRLVVRSYGLSSEQRLELIQCCCGNRDRN